MRAKDITAAPAHRPTSRELMPRMCMGSACPQKGACRPLPASLPNRTVPPLPWGVRSLLLDVETRQVHAIHSADFGRKEVRCVGALLGESRDFLHEEAE